MNQPSFLKRAAAVALGMAALAAAGAAQARSEVYFSIGVQPSHIYLPQPVYVQPQPVYVQPQPVYVQPRPIYFQPQPVYVPHPGYYHRAPRRGPWGDHDRDGVPNLHDPDHPRNQWRPVERPYHGYRY